ncbi:MAG TPA: hypothetical protein VMG30_01815 [Acidobacteriota bacterium]|nr:hypothetical protein [Acidobacteriota bacterium]
MSDDFGLLNLVVSPILERVAQEDRLQGDQQRKQRAFSKSAKKPEHSVPSEAAEGADESMSSNLIDLRI